MKERTKKILLWTGIGLVVASTIAVATTFVIMKENKKKEETHKNIIDNNIDTDKKSSKLKNELDKENDNEETRDEEFLLDDKNKKEVDWREIFPDIKSSDYYDKLNYRDGQAWIDEDMIVYIIKDILNRMLVTNGEVNYAYKQIDDQNLLITFKWNNDDEKSSITYKIYTNKV
ncbi:MHO_1590 family protein [Metamycoplasma gateae]|uniref:Lipoprotein n=1 Tax=Metamycoplasma gateae TaxID=35769 RepID=A0ABZ2AHH9_9BACT|nr:hypothetical protein V2E26_01135 [Metamycoplasma gateae]